MLYGNILCVLIILFMEKINEVLGILIILMRISFHN